MSSTLAWAPPGIANTCSVSQCYNYNHSSAQNPLNTFAVINQWKISFVWSRCRGQQPSWSRGLKKTWLRNKTEGTWVDNTWKDESQRWFDRDLQGYKILTVRERVKKEDFFQLRQREYDLRGHQYSLEVHRSRINIRSHVLSQRTVKHWNALPDHVVSATSVNNFKNRLDSCEEWGNWKRKLLQPDTIKYQVSSIKNLYSAEAQCF